MALAHHRSCAGASTSYGQHGARTIRPFPGSRGSRPARLFTRATAGQVADRQAVKAELLQLVSALNASEAEPSPADLRRLSSVLEQLQALNPNPDSAISPLINGRWALVYTTSKAALSSSKGAGQQDPILSPLQSLSDSAYKVFYRYLPVLAGSAVGKRGSSSPALKSRGNFQVFDTATRKVDNISKFTVGGAEGRIRVEGTADVVQPQGPGQPTNKLKAVFKRGELEVGGLRVPIPLEWLSPVGYVVTPYLDDDLRVSVGDKGSLFIASRVRD